MSARWSRALRWVGYGAAALTLSAGMSLLGSWQWERYQEKRANNARMEATAAAAPIPLRQALTPPSTEGAAAMAPAADRRWTKVTVTGRYDSAREILARNRTVNGRVGFEVLTPLLLDDGTAIIVNRGWVQAPVGDALARPTIPPASQARVTLTGRISLSESSPRQLQRHNGRVEVRRINLNQLAAELPYRIHHAYLLMISQTPSAGDGLTPIPISTANAWQSGTYAVQWWMFAAAPAGGYIWAAAKARRTSRCSRTQHPRPTSKTRPADGPVP